MEPAAISPRFPTPLPEPAIIWPLRPAPPPLAHCAAVAGGGQAATPSISHSLLYQSRCGLLLGMMLNAIVMWNEDFGIWYASSCSKIETSSGQESTDDPLLPWYKPGFLNDSDALVTNYSVSYPSNRVRLYWPAPNTLNLRGVQSIGLLVNSAVLVFRNSLLSASFRGICGEIFCRYDSLPLIPNANYTFTWVTFGAWGAPNMVSHPLQISTYEPDNGTQTLYN